VDDRKPGLITPIHFVVGDDPEIRLARDLRELELPRQAVKLLAIEVRLLKAEIGR
jgi:hypothetical protein